MDGCFWHMCPAHVRLPKNNRAWWVAKLEANVARDREKDRRLAELGWLSVHVWEHDDPVSASDLIAGLWSERR